MEKNELLEVPHLIYVMDPMCSWCYGFAPVIRQVKEEQAEKLRFKLVMGGLRPGATTPLDAATDDNIKEHWQEVAQATSQPFDFSFFDRKDFVFDTEPGCRAVVAMRYLNPAKEMEMAEEVQQAFYAHNQDVTNPDVLATIAEKFDVSSEAFLDKFNAEQTVEKTKQDFLIAQSLRAIAFPSLYLLQDKEIHLISRGYKTYEAVNSRLQEILHGPRPM